MASSIRIARLKSQAAEASKGMTSIATKAADEDRALTDEERTEFDKYKTQAEDLVKSLNVATEDAAIISAANSLAKAVGTTPAGPDDEEAPKGKHLGLTGKSVKSFARKVAGTMQGERNGEKALLPSGQSAVATPLLSESPIVLEQVPTSILDVLNLRQTGPQFEYLRQNARDMNAAVVAPGALKPTSTMSLERIEGKLKVVAHLSEPMHEYWLKDAANLNQFVELELLYGLRLELERQVLYGAGNATELKGILTTSGIQAQVFATDLLTTTRKSITKMEKSGHTAGIFILSPDDWESLELARTDTAGSLELGGPVDRAAQKLWGVPVVTSNQLAVKAGALLDLASVDVATDTQGIETRWSEAVGDDFQRNQIRARCEGRFETEVYQPLGIVKMATAAA
ncbi:UNVERIFIED_ORG: HK97 family phage major capsid protein [Nocardia globerula]|uniref:HK97 family phage major capsid protein n=1 Tax=Nocardia globerula TaxID=1818 RepID=A0A652YY79_NOCGL|nr:phage major capsid protein [Rhodococcus globerulus]NMD58974.1 phage major capsid protein [Nocardia globerula]PVX64961.1 HK97 family phage major capsid protein [Rhodococcus globerulus]